MEELNKRAEKLLEVWNRYDVKNFELASPQTEEEWKELKKIMDKLMYKLFVKKNNIPE